MLDSKDFFDFSSFEHKALFEANAPYVWDTLRHITDYIQQWLAKHRAAILGEVSPNAYLINQDQIFIGEGTVIEPGVYVAGPTIIGRNCTIRHGAYLRGDVIIGEETLIGHATEIKHAVLMNHSQSPHFNYIGDSLIGNHVLLGAGTKVSNLQISRKHATVKISIQNVSHDTGLAKLGGIIGDGVQIGSNCVLSPGCLVGPRNLIYPNISLRKGYYDSDQVIKLRQAIHSSPLEQ